MPSPSSHEAELSSRKYDIIANLPIELVLEVFDHFSDTEMVQLCRVSKIWKARIEAKWTERVHYLPKNGRKDWPNRLPVRIRPSHFPKNLRYLRVNACRLEGLWQQNLGRLCPVLKTLVIEDACDAPLDVAESLLAGSSVVNLQLICVTIQHCDWWLPQLSACSSLEELHLSLMSWNFSHGKLKFDPPPNQKPQGLMSSLQTLRVDVPSTYKDDTANDSRHWMRNGWVAFRDRQYNIFRGALRNLVHRAPKLQNSNTGASRDLRWGTSTGILKALFNNRDMLTRRWKTGLFEGGEFDIRWFVMFESLQMSNVWFEEHHWPSLWASEIRSLSIIFTNRCPHSLYIAMPLAQNIQYLELSDPLGTLAHAFFYTLSRGALSQPLTSLQTLSLSRPAKDLRSEQDRHWDSGLPLQRHFKKIDEGDIRAITIWLPKLTSVEILRIYDVSETKMRRILQGGLPDLKHLKVERLKK